MSRALVTFLLIGVLGAPSPASGDPSESSCSDARDHIAELEQALARAQPSGDWSQLRRGQSRADVLHILGEPGRTIVYAGFERWEYPDLRGGRVNFDDQGRAMGWKLPPSRRSQ